MIVNTNGKWQPFEVMTRQTLEEGKTYEIEVDGICEFAISKERPQVGIRTNKITYTKGSENKLWILTK